MVMMSFMQMVGTLVDFNLNWPPELKELISSINFVNINVEGESASLRLLHLPSLLSSPGRLLFSRLSRSVPCMQLSPRSVQSVSATTKSSRESC